MGRGLRRTPHSDRNSSRARVFARPGLPERRSRACVLPKPAIPQPGRQPRRRSRWAQRVARLCQISAQVDQARVPRYWIVLSGQRSLSLSSTSSGRAGTPSSSRSRSTTTTSTRPCTRRCRRSLQTTCPHSSSSDLLVTRRSRRETTTLSRRSGRCSRRAAASLSRTTSTPGRYPSTSLMRSQLHHLPQQHPLSLLRRNVLSQIRRFRPRSRLALRRSMSLRRH
ncbi:hypothetical protein BKA62DRAFT_66688 [Auriculariales sp. MPI-PUGE-AT-0066]|nr:hypothetical protein BKA62DRAFT_66688 [Auriculariales sp. MPI-PUGE-AT-0066]